MFDVFYLDRPTGLFVHERKAKSIEDAKTQSRTKSFWIVNYLCDYSDFDFLWTPLPHQQNQTHIWPSQHQKNSGTWLVPKISDSVDVNREHISVPCVKSVPRLHIKHNHTSADAGDINTRYISDYLGTLRRVLSKVDWEYCWVTADVCDYSNFDFTWHPSEWQLDMLHVFGSSNESNFTKFGDTFYVHVPSFLEKIADLKILEWFETLNFVEDISVPRLPIPAVKYTTDSVVPSIWDYEFASPLVQFYKDKIISAPAISLWQEKTKTVVPLTTGAGSVIIPRECKNYLKTQVYDYPYIDKSIQKNIRDPLSDVVFISNGESMADQNWKNLLSICPRAKRSDGINGREAAYKAAALVSNTPWFFAVFAKTEVLPSFDFTFQADCLQQPKHYIFYSRNPLNGLEYGSMNINLYNRQLTLDTRPGLDFTLSSLHEVIPIVASIARFNTDPWVSWRSAFREVLKLKREVDIGSDVEIKYRLDTWCSIAVGDNSEWVLQGAQDALSYYQEVNGNLDALMLSFDWAWLQQWFEQKHHQQLWIKT
jgi:hypothetical protein